jgi:hypothetical protein
LYFTILFFDAVQPELLTSLHKQQTNKQTNKQTAMLCCAALSGSRVVPFFTFEPKVSLLGAL